MPTQQDTFTDESKLNETLGTTVTGGELISEDLQSGNVLSFDGVNDFVSYPISALGTGDYSISSWFRCVGGNSNRITSQSNHINPSSTPFEFPFIIAHPSASKIGIQRSAFGDYSIPFTDDGRWHHVTITRTSGVVSGFVDGIEQVVTSGGSDYDQSGYDFTGTTFWTSKFHYVSVEYFTSGEVAQLLVFGYALTAEQVAKLYKYGYDNAGLPAAISYWKLDEGTGTSAADSVGSNNGTITGATWADGKIYTLESRTTSTANLSASETPTSITNFKYTTSKKGGGVGARMGFSQDYDTQRENVLSFDGVDDYVSIADDASLDIGTNDFSISTWVKTSSETSQGIYYKHTGNPATLGYDIRITSTGGVIVDLHDGVDRYYTSTSEVVWDGAWHHIVGVVDRDSAANTKIYMDGTSLTTTPVGTIGDVGTVTNATSVYLGSTFADTTKRYFDGSIADTRVYDDVLTADEVNYLYTSGKEGTDPTTANLVSQWLLDEGTGTSAADNAGSNTGTITSATWATNTDLAHITSTWKNVNNDALVRGAYSFDGVNDNIEVDGLVSTISSDTFGTWCAWIKVDSFDASGGRIIALGDTNAIGYLELSTTTSGELQASARSSSGVQWDIESDEILVVGKRYHVTLVQDGTEPVLYINGSLAPSAFAVSTDKTVWATDLSAQLDNAYIGDLSFNSNGLGTYTWDGEISDVQVYDAALSASEIWDIYANSKPRATNQVSRWKLNGNALDEWGANDGTVSGALPLPARANTPVVGDSLNQRSIASFDGVNDYISIPDSADLSFGNGTTDSEFSYGFWIKANEANGDGLVTKRDIGVAEEYEVQFSGVPADGMLFQIWDASTNGKIATKTGVAWEHVGEWAYVVVTYDASSTVGGMKTYVNGLEIPTTDVSSGSYTAMEDTGEDVVFGAFNDPSGYFGGNIVNVALYSDVRTASEVLTDYENGYIDETDANLVSYWPLDGDYLDWKGSNDGTNNGSTIVKAIDGPMGKRNFGSSDVLSFDGSSGFIEVTNSTDFDVGTSDEFSITAWIKTTSATTNMRIATKRDSDNTAPIWAFNVGNPSTGVASFRVNDNSGSGGQADANGTVAVNDGCWHHLVGVLRRDGSDSIADLYIDGSLHVTDTTATMGSMTTTGPLYIGQLSTGIQRFNGDISDVLYYNDALTADEIKYLYSNGDQGSDPTTTNLVSQWLLDEGTGTTATDNAGSNTGTITSATWDKALVPPMNLNNQVTMDVTSLSATDTIFVRAYMDNLIERSTSPVAFAEWTIEYLAAGGIVSENSLFFGTMF
tara:strand:- start:1459 stop:5328 length:3870 start_codon:yes stop_codon:yes gene_type:complete